MTRLEQKGATPVSGAEALTLAQGTVRLTGIQALVRVLIDQARLDEIRGLTTAGFVSGYPGSPIGGLHGELDRHDALLRDLDILHSPGLNEELAATAVWGAQTVAANPDARVDGVFALWYGKAPGVDRAGDALRHGAIRGVAKHGGVLVVAGDDPHANATVFPTDSSTALQAWGMPILYPGSTQDVVDLGLHGYALSRASGLWVGFKMTTPVADGTGTAGVGPKRFAPRIPVVEIDSVPFEPTLRVDDIGPGLRPAEQDLREGRLQLAAAYIRENALNPVTVDPASARLGIIAPGKSYYDVRQALRSLGLDDAELVDLGVRIKKVSALSPVDPREWRDFADGLSRIVVVEEKVAFLETALKNALYDLADRPSIVGKTDSHGAPLLPAYDELTPDAVSEVLAGQLRDLWPDLVLPSPQQPPARTLLPLLPTNARAGFFCSGCPHNTSLVAPEGATVGTGIGCHTMALLVPRPEHGNVTGFTQMGGEGAQWIGQAPFVTTPHIFQNVGDGTFHHSASLAVRAAIAADVNITYKLLYNSVIGMTGGQDVRGMMAVPALVSSLLAEGVRAIVITTDQPRKYRRTRLPRGVKVWHRDRILEAQERLARVPGVTVLIHDQHCAAERRRLIRRGKLPEPTKRVFIHERVCEGCGDCNRKSECLSVQPVETEFGRKTTIHQSSCNFDYSCLEGDCPSFLTVTVGKGVATTRDAGDPPVTLKEPARTPVETFAIHMTGIGGTGVVSINQVLATAAGLDGFRSRSLDLTGSAIKAGPVTSQLQLFREGVEPSVAIAAGHADLYLGFDLLAAMRLEALAPLSPDHTVVVASTSEVPTARMAFASDAPYPALEGMRTLIDGMSRRRDNVYLDAEALAQEVLGSHLAANALLVGVACQVGALPLRATSIERAFGEQGVAVEQNIKAFRWGRAVAIAPDLAERGGVARRPVGTGTVTAQVSAWIDEVDPGEGLRGDLEVRVPDLLDYQNRAYVERYLAAVSRAVAEEVRRGFTDERASRAVARNLYKLLAYKDEYEVARLLLQTAPRLAKEFGPDVKVTWNLHPPALRALGLRHKIRLGGWFRPGMQALRSMRRVRGHWFDPFGRAGVRRLERALVHHYEGLLEAAWSLQDDTVADDLAALLETPDLVRGYEQVKVASVETYLARVRECADPLGLSSQVATLAEKVEGLVTVSTG